jgi:hypothetical protein
MEWLISGECCDKERSLVWWMTAIVLRTYKGLFLQWGMVRDSGRESYCETKQLMDVTGRGALSDM